MTIDTKARETSACLATSSKVTRRGARQSPLSTTRCRT